MKATLSNAEARRIALAAQGFVNQNRRAKVSWPTMKRELKRLHLLQIDSVNVLCRSHYLPLFSRLGTYDRAALDKRTLNTKNREFFECWAHEASLVRMDLHPLLRWRMERARNGDSTYRSMNRFAAENMQYLKDVLAFVSSNGPTAQSDLPEQHKGAGGWWGWSKNKHALECLFAQGLLTTAKREGFERFYDVPDRVIPAEILNLSTPPERDAMRQLIDLSGQTLGIGTEFDLRDYFRLPVAETKQAIADAVESGVLRPVSVSGWKHQAYVHAAAKLPRTAGATALVSPFDPIIWDRDRAERVFNFHYRIELYTPAPKRKFGYYVLPFLHGDHFAGRICLKADRQNNTLLVNASHIETGRDRDETAVHLAVEVRRLSNWLGLSSVSVAKKGPLATALISEVRKLR
jgi:uncharacterized protein